MCRIWDPQENDSGILLKETEHFAYKYLAADPFRLKKLTNTFNTASPLVTISLKTLQLLAIIGLAELSPLGCRVNIQHYHLYNRTSFSGFS